MRICLYTNTALPRRGGQEYVVDCLAREYVAHDHDVCVLAPVLSDRAADKALPYTVSRHPRFISTYRCVDPYAWFLRLQHKARRFDIVHCHGIYPTGYLAAMSRRRLRVPIAITCHDGPTAADPQSIKRSIVRQRCGDAVRHAHALVAVNDLTRQGYLRYGADAQRIATIPQGVDAALFDDCPKAQLPNAIAPKRYMLYIGRLAKQKGVDVLIEAFAKQPWRHEGKLVIAGIGPHEPVLRQLATALGVADAVHFTGWVSGQTKTALLQHARCTVAPSRLPESFCLAPLESHAACTPAIVTDVDGLRERVADGITGWLVPAGSATSLASAMQSMWLDPDRAAEMGRAGRKHAQAFDWPSIADEHLKLYHQLIHAHASHCQGVTR